jgi:VIT1/CCC1 family predicted Fe2+/Mn2+ transporter
VIADGYSMAISSYLSAKTEQEGDYAARTITPMQIAVTTFISFVIMGMVPLASFLVGHYWSLKGNKMYKYAYFLTGIALFIVGYHKGSVLNQNPFYTGLQTLFIGGSAAFLAYLVGKSLRNIA